jgi:hypothetical protein
MTNAGRRGKKVLELTVIPKTHNDAEAARIISPLADAIVAANMTYAQVVAYLEASGKDMYRLVEQELRGIDIEPAATKIELENKRADGSTLRISASPNDFLVKSSVPLGGRAASGMMQDTLYSPAGSAAVRKKSAGLFYDWLCGRMGEANKLGIEDLRRVWDSLGVTFDYH